METTTLVFDILKGLFGLYAAWFGISYYRRHVNNPGVLDEKWQLLVDKYGWIYIVLSLSAFVFGLMFLVPAIKTLIVR